MKTTKWLLAGAVLSYGGIALANGDYEERAEQTQQEASSEVQEEGREVRTGMEEAEQDVEQAAEEAEQETDAWSERAAERTDAVAEGVASSVDEATDVLTGEPSQLRRGELDDGEVRNTLVMNPFGFFTGAGLDLTYARPLTDKFSAVIGGQFARASAGETSLTNFGLRGGADYFVVGENNEGFRVGPRVEVGIGLAGTQEGGGFGGLGAGGELGYNWISTKGLTVGAGAGVMAGLSAGREAVVADEGIADGRIDPYGQFNIGYSW